MGVRKGSRTWQCKDSVNANACRPRPSFEESFGMRFVLCGDLPALLAALVGLTCPPAMIEIA